MPAANRAQFELVDTDGKALGCLTISVLPNLRELYGLPAMVDTRDSEPLSSGGVEPVQLLEGCEYLYEVEGGTTVEIDKSDLFFADDATARRGRLRTKLFTGRVDVNVAIAGVTARPFSFEIRSTKLGYLDDYRWMLEDIAELSAELLLERFAPSEQRLAIDVTTDARAIYQRFVFLRGLLEGERLGAAIRRVVAAPYAQWEMSDEVRSPRRGLRGGGRLVRQLSQPGPQVDWPASPHAGLNSLPLRVRGSRTEETLDNVPNRFVRFALEEWRGLVASLMEVLELDRHRAHKAVPAPVARGLREGAALADYLDDLIRSPVFNDVGTLTEFPFANQVLHKKEGYRDVLHAYLVVQLGASLAWAGGEDVFSGGQRNVATLYEYWVYLELAKIVSELCDEPLDQQTLVAESATGMNLVLRREHSHAIRGSFRRRARSFHVELCFNQQFAPGPNGTWTKSLRPDCSLHIIPREPERAHDEVWLHFDAKYRMSRIEELFGSSDDEPASVAKAEDLYKMHTYRDAIVHAVGAYVVFPGTEKLTREQYEEVLPGLGAFPLRPSRGGRAEGSAMIREFLQQVFDHVASQTTKHERARHWRRLSTSGPHEHGPRDAVSFLRAPPADTPVLLGFVKSAVHHAWIEQHGLYNLRADADRRGAVGLRGPELSAEVVALHGELGLGCTLFRVVDEPRLITCDQLVLAGYPEPNGKIYFCIPVEPILDLPKWWDANVVVTAAGQHRGQRPPAAPVVVSWRDLTET